MAGLVQDRFGRAEAPVPTSADLPQLAPAALELSGPASWDGVPSLGGIWIAHPDVDDPVRVTIRRAASGQSAEGWLFGREADGEGPGLRLSSEAAAALGIAAGEVAEVFVEPMTAAAPEEVG